MAIASDMSSKLASLRERLVAIRRERARLDAEEASIIREMDATVRDLSSPEFVIPVVELTSVVGLSQREASRVVARSAALTELPVFDGALANGDITAAHVDSLAAGLKRLEGADRERLVQLQSSLLQSATHLPVDQFAKHVRSEVARLQSDGGLAEFERQRRSTYLRTWNDADGMLHLRGAFDPERGSVLLSRLERRMEAMFHSGDREVSVVVAPGIEPNDHRRALALLSALEGDSSQPHEASSVRSEIIVHIDLATLTGSLTAAGITTTQHGVSLPVETVRRLACDAEIIPVVLSGEGVPLDVGRSKRLATVHQRRALGSVHETCAVSECAVAFKHCEPHHIDYWENGGSTSLDNLIPLCSRHHHAAHEGGWKLLLDPATRELSIDRGPPCR
jgi:hypothetical protein